MRASTAVAALLACVVAADVSAQVPCGSAVCIGSKNQTVRVGGDLEVSGRITTAGVPNATSAAASLYVDPTGSDSNACAASGASACLTLQGAINKLPKYHRHGATINLAAGSFA